MFIRILSIELDDLEMSKFNQRWGFLTVIFFFQITTFFTIGTKAFTIRWTHIKSFQLIFETSAFRLQK